MPRPAAFHPCAPPPRLPRAACSSARSCSAPRARRPRITASATSIAPREVVLKGTVKAIDFVNPHAYVYFDVAAADGTQTPYRCEMRAATVLRRSGWSAGDVQARRADRDHGRARSLRLALVLREHGRVRRRHDRRSLRSAREAGAAGRTASAAPRAARLPSGEPNISGDWAPEQFVMTDPRGRDGALVPVSQVEQFKPGDRPNNGAAAARIARARTSSREAGKKASESFNNFTRDNPRMRCETTSILFDWTFDGPVNRITQSGDTITLQYGQLGFTRTIHLNAQHPATIAPWRGGHSIGKWENDVLVVDTVGFAPGVLSPPVMNSARAARRRALRVRSGRAEDHADLHRARPALLHGRIHGHDTIGVADLPYAPDACKELTFDDFSNDGTAPGGVASTPLPGPAGPPGAGRRAPARTRRAPPPRPRRAPSPRRPPPRRRPGGSSGSGGTRPRRAPRAS